jgi:hypothetical protein
MATKRPARNGTTEAGLQQIRANFQADFDILKRYSDLQLCELLSHLPSTARDPKELERFFDKLSRCKSAMARETKARRFSEGKSARFKPISSRPKPSFEES